jgi:hypothetical protein
MRRNLELASIILSIVTILLSPVLTYAVASAVHSEQINHLRNEMVELKASKSKIDDMLNEIKNATSDIRDRISKVEGFLDKSKP